MKIDTLKLRRCKECNRLFQDYPGAVCDLRYQGLGSPKEIDLCKSCRCEAASV